MTLPHLTEDLKKFGYNIKSSVSTAASEDVRGRNIGVHVRLGFRQDD